MLMLNILNNVNIGIMYAYNNYNNNNSYIKKI